MKQFLIFVKKEFYHIFRDTRTILILLAMPIVQMFLFGFAVTTEIQNANVAVFDSSNDVSTQHIIERFQSNKYFTVTQKLTSLDQINDVFKYGNTDMVIVFGEKFAENLQINGGAAIQLIMDGTEPNQASMLMGYATGILSSYQQEITEQYKMPLQIVPNVRMLYNPQMKSAYNFVPGVMGLILMLICAMMTSISIVKEKEMGTMEILLSSPMKPLYIILAKTIPYFTLSIVNFVSILVFSVYVLDVPIAGSLFWLVVVSLIFIFLALALGLLISTVLETQMAAMLASGMVLMMPVMLLSGMMFPIDSMPAALQVVASVVPARWYIEAVKKIMIQGVDIRFVLKEIIILSSMTIFLLVVSLKQFKTRLK